MGRMLVAGLVVLTVGAFMVGGVAFDATNALGQVDTPTPTATVGTATPTASATATATGTVAATTAAATSPAGATTAAVTASPVQPAAVPVTGGDPSNGSASLALILIIGIGAVAGTAGVLAASYGLTRRS
jgi:hypothetical protein